MGYLVEAYLDPEADLKVRRLWDVLKERGISDSNLRNDSTPHLTLVTAPSLDEDAARAALGMVARIASVGLPLRGLALFPGEKQTLYLPVVPSRELLDLRRACVGVVRAAGGEAHDDRAWTPHVSLARRLPPVASPGAVGVMHDQDVEINARIVRIGLLRDRPIRRLGEFDLGSTFRNA